MKNQVFFSLTLILDTAFLDSFVNLVQKHIVMIFLLFPVIFLEACLIRALEQDIALDGVMEHKLLNDAFRLEAALLPAEFSQVVRCLGVARREHLEMNFIALLRCQLLLIIAWHVVIVLAEQILIILKIIVVVLLDLPTRGSFLCSTASRGHLKLLYLN